MLQGQPVSLPIAATKWPLSLASSAHCFWLSLVNILCSWHFLLHRVSPTPLTHFNRFIHSLLKSTLSRRQEFLCNLDGSLSDPIILMFCSPEHLAACGQLSHSQNSFWSMTWDTGIFFSSEMFIPLHPQWVGLCWFLRCLQGTFFFESYIFSESFWKRSAAGLSLQLLVEPGMTRQL